MGSERHGGPRHRLPGDPRAVLPRDDGRGEALLKTEVLDYALPAERIAQVPAGRRSDARLMVLHRGTAEIGHRRVSDLPAYLSRGDLLVVNDTRVIRGRLLSRKATGGAVEIFLLARRPDASDAGAGATSGATTETWEALARPSKRLAPGMTFRVGGELDVVVLSRAGRGRWNVALSGEGPVADILDRVGEVPLPPYIRRDPGGGRAAMDAERYQTVFAAVPGSVAAPTAGLHFDAGLIEAVGRAGADIARVTLSVGYGTFSPIRTEEVEAYEIHPEAFRMGEETASAVNGARAAGGRVVAVGTTSVRVLESCAGEDGRVRAADGETRLFIRPGYAFRAVDVLLTNFHLPRSSLLALVMAFAGVDRIREAYRVAVAEGYRFYSYGDAMLIL